MINQIYPISSLYSCEHIYIGICIYHIKPFFSSGNHSHSLQLYNGKMLFSIHLSYTMTNRCVRINYHLFPIHFRHTRTLSLFVFH